MKRAIFIGRGEDDECPEGLTPYEKLREMAADVTEAQLDAREREVGLDDVINMLYAAGPAVSLCAAVSLLRLCDRRVGGVYARRLPGVH